MGPNYAGVVCYADDITVMSPIHTGLFRMLNICSDFAAKYNLSFNAAKSQFMVFRKKHTQSQLSIEFSGLTIKEQQSVEHLGHIIFNDLRKFDSDRILATFWKQYNLFRSRFGHTSSIIQAKLLYSYCSSFYGCVLVPFKHMTSWQVAWRKCQRQVWRFPYRTHCSILRCLSPGLCERHMFVYRFTRFALLAMNNKCQTTASITKIMTANDCTFTRNLRQVCDLIALDITVFEQSSIDTITQKIKGLCNQNCKTDEDRSLADVLRELSLVRDNVLDSPLSKSETIEMITDICLN